MRPIRSVVINFTDGQQLTLVTDGKEESTAYYKVENFKNLFDTHSVFMIGVTEKEIPSF